MRNNKKPTHAQPYGDGISAPQFPGQQIKNLSIEDVRTLIKKQRRTKGFVFSVATGSTTFNLQLSGTARIMLGIAFLGAGGANFANITSCQFKVNNEIIIEATSPNFFTSLLTQNEYYDIPRPLSGTDEIILSFTNPGAVEVLNCVIYYI
jgi:hypothetical protein